MPAPSSVHIDAALTGFVLKEGQFDGVATEIAPAFPTIHRSDKYYKFGTEWMNANDVKPRAARAKSGEGRWAVSTGSFTCSEYPFKTAVEQDTIDNSDPQIDPMSNAALYVKSVVNLAWEQRINTMLTTNGNFTTVTGAGAAWTGSTQEADVDTAKEAIAVNAGKTANTIVIPPGLAKVLKRNTNIRDLVKYTQPDLLVNGDLPPYLWGLKVVIPGIRQATANEGATQTPSRLYAYSAGATKVQVLYVDPNAGNLSVTWASTMRWSKFGIGGEGIRTWWVDDGRYWYVEYATYQTEFLVSANCGAMITGC